MELFEDCKDKILIGDLEVSSTYNQSWFSPVLSRFSPGSLQVLSSFSSGSLQVLLRFSPGFLQVVSGFSPGSLQVLFRFFSGSLQVLSRFFPIFHQFVSRCSPGSFLFLSCSILFFPILLKTHRRKEMTYIIEFFSKCHFHVFLRSARTHVFAK